MIDLFLCSLSNQMRKIDFIKRIFVTSVFFLYCSSSSTKALDQVVSSRKKRESSAQSILCKWEKNEQRRGKDEKEAADGKK